MNFRFLLLIPFLCLTVYTQEKMLTQEEAKQIIEAHSRYDTAELDKRNTLHHLFEGSKVNDIIITKNVIYEVLDINEIPLYSAAYIYFDGSKLSLEEINRLRETVLENYNKGIPYIDLIREYNMDKNPESENFLFADKQTVEEFETAVKNHKPGEIFTVDVPKRKWYYVVMRNPDPDPTVFKVRYVSYSR